MDWNLGEDGPTGLELCSRIRALSSSVWILFLTVRDSEDDKLRGFEARADDYLSKDASPRELVARLESLERRIGLGEYRLRSGRLTVDLAEERAWVDAEEIPVTPHQLRLLVLLIRNVGNAVSSNQIRTDILRTTASAPSSSVRDLVCELRARLGTARDIIQTVPGVGYSLRGAADPRE